MTGRAHVCLTGLEHALRCPCCCTSASTLASLSAFTRIVKLPMLKPGVRELEAWRPLSYDPHDDMIVVFAKLQMYVAEQ